MSPQEAWKLFLDGKVKSIGFEPYCYVPGEADYVVTCLCGWSGEPMDTIEYTIEEFDKFAEYFADHYPSGCDAEKRKDFVEFC